MRKLTAEDGARLEEAMEMAYQASLLVADVVKGTEHEERTHEAYAQYIGFVWTVFLDAPGVKPLGVEHRALIASAKEVAAAKPADDNLSYYFDNCVGPTPQGERRIWGIEDAEGL